MAIKEVFKNPTVKQVVFQIVFPNFFSIESKIGDYQIKIMEKFPKSTLLIQNNFIISNPGLEKINKSENEQNIPTKKIWQFKTQDEDVILNVSSNSLDIVSTSHKTYNNGNAENKFRDTIDHLVGEFLRLIPLITISKVGLRYIDDCPIPEVFSKENFLEYYNSFINFSNIEDIQKVEILTFNSIIKKSELYLRYTESIIKVEGKYKYTMDFDGQILNIPASSYLSKLDLIHTEIADLYENIIKEPVIKIMNS